MKQEDLGGLFDAGVAVEADEERGGQRVGRHQDVEAAHELDQRQVVRIALAVEADGRQDLRAAQLRAQQRHVQGVLAGRHRRRRQVDQAGAVVRQEAVHEARLGPPQRLDQSVLTAQ